MRSHNRSGRLELGVGVLICLLLLGSFAVTRGVAYINFHRNCESYLDTAAHANSVALAHEQLQKAINYLDSQGINENSAYTSIFYNDQTENVGYWKTNLDTCLKELESLPKTSSMQEQSNVLMRLRESLVTHGQSGDSVRHPDGIEIYPNNVLFMVWGVLSVPGLIVMAALSN